MVPFGHAGCGVLDNVLAAVVSHELLGAGVHNDKAGDAIDTIALLDVVDLGLIVVVNCEPWHLSEVALEGVF